MQRPRTMYCAAPKPRDDGQRSTSLDAKPPTAASLSSSAARSLRKGSPFSIPGLQRNTQVSKTVRGRSATRSVLWLPRTSWLGHLGESVADRVRGIVGSLVIVDNDSRFKSLYLTDLASVCLFCLVLSAALLSAMKDTLKGGVRSLKHCETCPGSRQLVYCIC